ncbi:MAG: alpha-amylase family glycosyl hydrolase [Bacteroidota bacterium]
MTNRFSFLIGLAVLMLAWSCQNASTEAAAETETPDLHAEVDAGKQAPELNWMKNANIYEVNVRQYTPEGTFAAFAEHLPRLKAMGVDILWFMPIHPISEKNRKGTLGSYYAVADFKAINPEFGTMDDWKALVDTIHAMDMKVLIDWVPGHTGWDNHWITEHPEWYLKGPDGEITDPIQENGETYGWTDVADIDYTVPGLRNAMIDAMKFWVTESNIDGYRVDVAHSVPDDFWDEAVPQLHAIKPLFMLAEAEHAEHRNSGNYHMSYAWTYKDLINEVAQGKKKAEDIKAYFVQDRENFKKGWHMMFTTNHDENTWNGTVYERHGDAVDAMTVLTFTVDGMPLIYSGQEAGMDKRLEFFEKDQIDWGDVSKETFYAQLLTLKHENKALWNGSYGGEPQWIETNESQDVIAFSREKEDDKVVVFVNLSAEAKEVKLNAEEHFGNYTDVFGNTGITLSSEESIQLAPHNYLVLSK